MGKNVIYRLFKGLFKKKKNYFPILIFMLLSSSYSHVFMSYSCILKTRLLDFFFVVQIEQITKVDLG